MCFWGIPTYFQGSRQSSSWQRIHIQIDMYTYIMKIWLYNTYPQYKLMPPPFGVGHLFSMLFHCIDLVDQQNRYGFIRGCLFDPQPNLESRICPNWECLCCMFPFEPHPIINILCSHLSVGMVAMCQRNAIPDCRQTGLHTWMQADMVWHRDR